MTVPGMFVVLAGAAASAATLTDSGANFGRRSAADLPKGLTVTVAGPAATPDACFVIARYQDNRPLMLARDGLWEPWDGDPATLTDSGCVHEADQLAFEITTNPLSDMPFPVVFTFGYRFLGETRSGFLTVDEQ